MSDEPPIDTSLSHYMEERALAVALEKATAGQRAKVERLSALRAELMAHREAWLKEVTAKRHARGEIYSAARVAAINAMAPTREAMDRDVKALYAAQADADGVLRVHARTHFAHALVSQRLLLPLMTPDIAQGAREAQAREERFAREWVAAIGDAAFAAELKEAQREALVLHRTSSRPMVLVGAPDGGLDDADAAELGRAWTKLDGLAQALSITPLSAFIAFDEEGDEGGVPAGEILAVVQALHAEISSPARKFPAKKATLAVLGKLRTSLERLRDAGGRARFEVDL